ncbi:MAG: DMT family transporter [Firmicutes bacterium]|nr:DMT family transporter [Bacillota bacterium]
MTIAVIAWGLEFIIAKETLAYFDPLTLLFFKYSIALLVMIALHSGAKKVLFRKKDVPLVLLAAAMGLVGYYALEYIALEHLPVASVSIAMSLVPLITIGVEGLVLKRGINAKMLLGIIACTIGAVAFIGFRPSELFGGNAIGYICIAGAAILWAANGFLLEKLQTRYKAFPLTFFMLVGAVVMLAPRGLVHIPDVIYATPAQLGGLVYLGVVGACFGLVIETLSIHEIGVTPTMLFTNFIPVGSSIFGVIFLGEAITAFQVICGIAVIAAGCVVIREKSKLGKDPVIPQRKEAVPALQPQSHKHRPLHDAA